MEKTETKTEPQTTATGAADPILREKMARLGAVGRVIYQAIVATNPPASLAMAARSQTSIDRLSAADTIALALIAAECMRGGLMLSPAGEAAAIARQKPTVDTFEKRESADVLKPDAITPPEDAGSERRKRNGRREPSVSEASGEEKIAAGTNS